MLEKGEVQRRRHGGDEVLGGFTVRGEVSGLGLLGGERGGWGGDLDGGGGTDDEGGGGGGTAAACVVTSHDVLPRGDGDENSYRTALRYWDTRMLFDKSSKPAPVRTTFTSVPFSGQVTRPPPRGGGNHHPPQRPTPYNANPEYTSNDGVFKCSRSPSGLVTFTGYEHLVGGAVITTLRSFDGLKLGGVKPGVLANGGVVKTWGLWVGGGSGWVVDVVKEGRGGFGQGVRVSEVCGDAERGGNSKDCEEGGDRRKRQRVATASAAKSQREGYLQIGHEFNISCVAFSADDTMFATGDAFGSVFLHRTWG